MSKQSNILDPVNEVLDPTVWDAPASPTPKLKLEHKLWAQKLIYDRFNDNGYDVQNWASFYLTGSLTTYQYSEDSDFDISLFVNTDIFPDWSRAEMIAIAVEELDGNILPRTTHPLQVFVVPEGIQPKDLYKKGLRSGYELANDRWVNPPDPELAQDPEVAYNAAYTHALEQADKMERLLKYEPHKAQTFWHQIHKRRRADQRAGKGDYAPSNIVYKMLANRGLLEEISDVTGEYIAKVAKPVSEVYWSELTDEDPYVYHTTDLGSLKSIKAQGLLPWDDENNPRASLYNQESLSGLNLPRPGHIYFALAPRPFEPDEDKILRVPKSALDPNLINPDEDGLYDEDLYSGRLGPQVGEQAEAWGYGDDEAETERSVERLQTLAYRGSVPPEQIEIMIRSSGDEWAPNPHESKWVPLQQYSA